VQYKEAILAYAVLLKEDKGQVCWIFFQLCYAILSSAMHFHIVYLLGIIVCKSIICYFILSDT
jgi:hypothetical protein